jgi:hypothetical protein
MSDRGIVVHARQAQIEFLRARAAYERQALSLHTTELGRELSPKRWFRQWLSPGQASNHESGRHTSNIISQALSLATQYPYLTATLSTVLVGKRWRWVKWVGVGLAAWQIVADSKQASKVAEP